MKRLFYVANLVIIPVLSYAQTINHMYDYTIGNTNKIMICDNTNIPPGNAGGNQQWSFTSLPVIDSVTEKVLSASNTPFASAFPTASLAIRNNQGIFTYYTQTATESQMLGSVDSFSGYTIIYSDPVLRAQRPFSYNSTVTDTFWTAGQLFSHGNEQMTADGWGTLQTPTDSYSNVLRVKSVYYELDSTNSGSAPIISELTATTYSWFSDAYGTPLLIWDSTHILNSIGDFSVKTLSYLQSSTPTGIKNISRNLQLSAYMQQGQLYVTGTFNRDKTYNMQLIGTDGKKVLSFDNIQGADRVALPMSAAIASGTYLLFVSDNAGNFGTIKIALP